MDRTKQVKLGEYISALAAWLSIMGTLIGVEIGLYQIAHIDASKQIAQSFLRSTQNNRHLSRAFHFSSRLSSLVFGPPLVSGRAFVVGFLLSVSVAAIAYLIAVATTPISRLEVAPNIVATPLRLLADIQFSYAASAPLRFWSWVAGIALALAWLSFEFLFVTKSRWLLRLIRETTSLLGLAAIYLVDIATSGLMLTIFAPVFIIIFGKIYLLFAGPQLNTDSMIVVGISSEELLPRDHVWEAYKFLCGAISEDIWRRLQGDFNSYYAAAVGALTDTGCRISDGPHLLVPSVLDSAVNLRIDDTATTESIRGWERDRGKEVRGKA